VGLTAVSSETLTSLILVLGAPRSGTTWLAKIVDSHPDVIYRHEPDKTLPGPSPLTSEAVPALLARWTADRSVRTATKRPYFAKSWQPSWARGIRSVFAAAVSAAARMPGPFRAIAAVQIPDLCIRPASHVVIKSIEWAEGAALMAHTLPSSRTIFIVRHPCGQVASVMQGHRQNRFDLQTDGTNMPYNEAGAIRHAASFGVNEATYRALPDAAKYAWGWRAFNETAYATLTGLPNVRIVLYEALCAHPGALSRRILAFAGLDWNRQTEDFVARSTVRRGSYYATFRNAAVAAEAWRTKMLPADQDAVRGVVAASPLARFWPDLTSLASAVPGSGGPMSKCSPSAATSPKSDGP
jgi:hypothetical protein